MLKSKKENIIEISLIGIDGAISNAYNHNNLHHLLKNICELKDVFQMVYEVYTFKNEIDDGIKKRKNIVELYKNQKGLK